MIYPMQTPTVHPTPNAIIRNLRMETRGQVSRKLDTMLEALKDNRFVPPDTSHPLSSTWERLEALYDLPENWNGYEMPAPNPDAIEHAKTWIQELYLDIQNEDLKWLTPHVSANEEGQVAFEWSRGRKRLAVYVSPNEAWYIKVWGPSVVTEMIDGQANTSTDRVALWSWLME